MFTLKLHSSYDVPTQIDDMALAASRLVLQHGVNVEIHCVKHTITRVKFHVTITPQDTQGGNGFMNVKRKLLQSYGEVK